MSGARTILKISGGAGSWAAGRKWRDENPGASLELLFTDTLCEDQDTYRFLIAGAANLLDVELPPGSLPGIEDFPAWEDRTAYKAFVLTLAMRVSRLMPAFHWLSDGRDIFDVMEHERFLGNSRMDPCSKNLKRVASDRWLRMNCDPADTEVLIGIGPDEEVRFKGYTHPTDPKKNRRGLRDRMADAGWAFRAPLMEGGVWWPPRVEREVLAVLWEQRLYRFGASHANCGGFCVKAGIVKMLLMYRIFPERFHFVRRWERRMRALLGDVSMLTDRRKTPENPDGDKRPLTLDALLTREITDEDLLDNDGCGSRCALGDDSNLEEAA